MDRIFVVIPSFQEEDLVDTVDSIFGNALNPDGISIGICNQRVDDGGFENFDHYGDRVRVVNVRSPQPLGLGFAYYTASKLIRDEEFVLRIDAHTRMKKNWDSVLLNYFKKIEQKELNSKIVLSQLTGGFYKVNLNKPDHIKGEGQDIWFHEKEPPNTDSWMNEQIRQLKLYAFNMSHDEPQNYDWTDHDLVNGYKEVHFISGSFHFAKNDFLIDCEPDPRVFFWGEEHIFAIRAWTRGYRIFSIAVNTQFTAGKPQEYLDTVGFSDWRNLRGKFDKSENVVKEILSGQEIGYYGAKDEKSYADYMGAIGFGDHITV